MSDEAKLVRGKKPLGPADLYQFKNVGDAAVSPDGTQVLYCVSQADAETDGNLTNIWIADTATRDTRRFTSSGKDSSPRWSPQGGRFAFVSRRSGKSQIWIAEMAGGEPWHLETEQAIMGSPVWSPDGKHISFTSREFVKDDAWVPYPGAPEWDRQRAENQARRAQKGQKSEKDDSAKDGMDLGATSDVKVATRFLYKADGSGVKGDLTTHLYIVEVPELAPEIPTYKATARRLTDGDYNHQGGAFSPDGKYLAFSAIREEDADYLNKQDLWFVDLASGRMLMLMDGAGPVRMPVWSPDGKRIAFLGNDRSYDSSTTDAIWVLDVEGFLGGLGGPDPRPLLMTDAMNLTTQFDRPIGNMAGSDVSYFGGPPPFLWEDPQTISFIASDKGAAGLFRITLPDKKIQPIWHDPERTLASISRAGGEGGPEKTTVILVGSPTLPNSLYLFRESDLDMVQLTDLNDWLSGYAVAQCQRFTYKGHLDWDIDGWIVYPAGHEPGAPEHEPYPTVLLIHGGPQGAYGSAFMFQAQMFASQGYAVVYTNPRGSQTYGQQFALACVEDWGGGDYKDIMAGVDHAIAMGVADPQKLFVTGWSYGGYMSSWVVTQTTRFKAAVAGAIISNLYSMWGTGDIPNYDEHHWGVPPWQARDRYFAMSPVTFVENVETPILFIHGEDDVRCPTTQSEEFYLSLRRLGKTAVFARYPGEAHGFTKPRHKVDRFERTMAWFQYYKGR